MKKVWNAMLVLTIVLTCLLVLPTTAEAATEDDLTFKLNPDKNSYYVAACNKDAYGELRIPDTYNGKPITVIGDSAFYNCSYLTSVSLPDTIITIGDSAFYWCTGLKYIYIYSYSGYHALEEIGDSAFYNCRSLYGVPMSDGLKSIGDSAFYNCEELSSVTFNDQVQTIGDFAFKNCKKLSSVVLPGDLQMLGAGVFDGCPNLRYNNHNYGYYLGSADNDSFLFVGPSFTYMSTIPIDDDTKHIYSSAFYEYTSLTTITIPDGVLSIGAYAFAYCPGLKTITIPDCVKYIDDGAFTDCTNLTDVKIGNGVETIGASAFADCSELTKVVFGNSVTSVGHSAFYNCRYLYDAYINDLSAWCKIEFVNADANPLRSSGNLYLNNTKITDLVIPEGVTSIGSYAFADGTGLKTVTIPDSVKYIGNSAFTDCENLTTVTIGNGVQIIGEDAFLYCDALTGVYIKDLAAWCRIDFENPAANPRCHTDTILYLNGDAVDVLTIPEGVQTIGDYAFFKCNQLKSVTIGNGVQTIGDYAFYMCNQLNSVTIGNGVQTIGNYAFYMCNQLKSVTILDSVKYIENYAFADCTNLTTVTIGNGVQTIGDYAFYKCNQLKSVTIPGSVCRFGKFAFGECAKLKTLTICSGVPEISQKAFKNCVNLETIFLPRTVKNVRTGALEGCSKITEVWYTGTTSDYIWITTDNVTFQKAMWHYNTCENEHIYSSECDGECNNCDWTRETTVAHTYVSICAEKCSICASLRKPAVEHTYETVCDAVCDICESERTAPHNYDGDCDTQCNDCGVTRNRLAAHTYANNCDTACDICGAVRAITHDYAYATCIAPKTCKVCGVTDGDALGHNYTNYKSNGDATCTADGTETAKCDRCNETRTQIDVDSKLGHSFTNYKSDGNATCTVDGTEIAKCDRCNETRTQIDVDSKLGHSFTNYKSNGDATCTADGTETAKCDRCDVTDSRIATGSAKGHGYESVVTPPTCLEKGYTTYTCECGENYVADYVNAKGHSYTKKVTKPTCTAKGYTTYTCACGDTYKGDYVNALGHSYKSGSCIRCKYKPAGAKITTQPKNVAVSSGKTATVTVKASGTGLKYTWYYAKKGAKSYTKASSTTNSYSLKMSTSYNGTKVYCVVSDAYGNSVKSAVVTLYKGTPAKITTQPKSTTVANGKTGSITLKASGSSLKYQWYIKYKGASAFAKVGKSSKTYSFKMASKLDGAQVYCVVKDKYGIEVKSSTVTIKMPVQPKITTQPKSTKAFSGKTVKFTVKATGEGLKYQWYYAKKGSNSFKKLSAKSATYSVKVSSSVDGRKYYCLVTDQYGQTVKTSTVTLTMQRAAKILTQPKNVTVKNGKAAKVTIKAEGDGLKYTWYYLLAGETKYRKAAFTGNTFSVTMAAKYKNAKVYCAISDQYGNTVKSKTVTLKIK